MLKINNPNPRNAGRKAQLTPDQTVEVLELHRKGIGNTEIAKQLPSIRSHGSAAYRASLEIRPWPLCQQRSLQRRIKGQNSLAEVAAISPRPAFPKHIALAIQRQAAAVPVIVGTPF